MDAQRYTESKIGFYTKIHSITDEGVRVTCHLGKWNIGYAWIIQTDDPSYKSGTIFRFLGDDGSDYVPIFEDYDGIEDFLLRTLATPLN